MFSVTRKKRIGGFAKIWQFSTGSRRLKSRERNPAPVSSSRGWRRSIGARRHNAPLAVIEPAARSRLRWRVRACEQRPLEYKWAPSDILFDGAIAHRIGETRTRH